MDALLDGANGQSRIKVKIKVGKRKWKRRINHE